MTFSASERETVVVCTDDADVVVIWSAIRRHITKMRKNPSFTETRNGTHGTSEWAEFTIAAELWSPAGVKRRVSLSSEQRESARTRLQQARGSSK